MNLNGNTLRTMTTTFDVRFKDAFNKQETLFEKFAFEVGDAGHTIVELPFFDAFAFMREWVGPRQAKALSAKKLTLTERPFEDTVKIPTRAIETDNWGVYAAQIAAMGQAGKKLWDRLCAEALCNPGNWVDGSAFFSTTRKYGKSTICNKTTSALTGATFKAAYDAMCAYSDHTGEPLCVTPTHLMVGPKLRETAWNILNNQYVADSSATIENPNKGLVELIVNKRLVGDYDDYWFLMSADGEIKPVALQKSKEATLVARTAATDEPVFNEGCAVWGAEAYGSAAAAFPHLVYGGIL